MTPKQVMRAFRTVQTRSISVRQAGHLAKVRNSHRRAVRRFQRRLAEYMGVGESVPVVKHVEQSFAHAWLRVPVSRISASSLVQTTRNQSVSARFRGYL